MIQRIDTIAREIHRVGEATPSCEYHLADARRLSAELRERYEGKIQLIYLDPPFQTGNEFQARVRVGAKEWKTGRGSLVLPAYNDDLSREEYLSLMRTVLENARALLRNEGMIFVHIDYRMHPYIRLMMDEIFGEKLFLNEIIWTYHSGGSARRYFPRKHDVILMYARSPSYDFHIADVAEPSLSGRDNHMKKHVDADGRVYRSIRSGGHVYTYYDDDPVVPDDVWLDVSHLQQKDPQRTGYDTQKPLKLLNRIVKCASRPGDIVMDLFSGSGTTLEAAFQSGRRFIGGDISPLAMQLARKRTEGAACEYVREPSAGNPQCEMSFSGGIAFTRVTLNAFSLEDGVLDRALPGLDAVDSWAAGYERAGVFHAYARENREHDHPSIAGVLDVPVYDGRLMARVSDVTGRDFFYRLDADA